MFHILQKAMHTCMSSKSEVTFASLCRVALQELLLELVLVTLWVRITWNDPPGTWAWNTSSCFLCRCCMLPSARLRARESTTCINKSHTRGISK